MQGGVTLATVVLFFHPPKRERKHEGIVQILIGLDLLGTALALAAMICILLALQDGGLTVAWSASRSIGLLVGFGVLIIAFIANEWFMKDNAIIPLRILGSRTVGFAALSNFGIGASYFSVAIFLPIYFQLLGSSSIRSGVQMLPLVCGVIFSVTLSGGLAPAIGYVQPFLYGGTVLAIIGSGLFQLFDAQTSQPYWIGVTFLFGIGMGACFQMVSRIDILSHTPKSNLFSASLLSSHRLMAKVSTPRSGLPSPSSSKLSVVPSSSECLNRSTPTSSSSKWKALL